MTLPNVLGVFAHPDDETIMAGGTLAMLHQSAIPTHLVIATRGEGGEAGDPPVVTDRRELGALREAELRCAMDSLGVTSLSLLGYVDPDVGPENTLSPFEADFDTLVGQIVEAIEAHRADVVIAHGPDGEYGHPAHKLVHRATAAAVARCAPDLAFYTVMARPPAPIAGDDDHLWNASRLAHFWLDISPWADAKIAAMECHRLPARPVQAPPQAPDRAGSPAPHRVVLPRVARREWRAARRRLRRRPARRRGDPGQRPRGGVSGGWGSSPSLPERLAPMG